MFIQLRENLWLASEDEILTQEQGKKIADLGISRIVIVADDITLVPQSDKFTIFHCPLKLNRMNPTHIKDLVCHTVKMMITNGDKVLIVGKTGKERGAYVGARVICEIEGKSIYDIFLEFQDKVDGFDIGKSYF